MLYLEIVKNESKIEVFVKLVDHEHSLSQLLEVFSGIAESDGS